MSSGRSRVGDSVRRHPWILGVTVAYVVGWTAYGLAAGSRLAIPYVLWLVFAGGVLIYLDGRVRFSTHVLVLLAVSGFGHLAGGNVMVDGAVLYKQSWGGLGYDHLVHAVGLGAAGLAVWEALCYRFRATSGWAAAVLALLGANAVGAVIEIGEYLASLVVTAAAVGDYANNMQDLIANMVGGLGAAWWARRGPGGIPRP